MPGNEWASDLYLEVHGDIEYAQDRSVQVQLLYQVPPCKVLYIMFVVKEFYNLVFLLGNPVSGADP